MSRRAGPRTNLPVERGTFVGRARLLRDVAERIAAGQRLTSLVGPEGIGKTRLALRSAALDLQRFGAHGGVWFVDATSMHDAADLTRVLLQLLGLLPEPGASLESEGHRALTALTEDGSALLVVDAVEPHVAKAFAPLLLACAAPPQLLCTSRVALDIPGAAALHVGPLKVAKRGNTDVRELLGTEAVQLFIERAGEARRGFSPSPSDVRAMAQIVRQLEGVPLAIEVAAARLRHLSAPELLERLPRNVALLAPHSAGEARPRARKTLEGAVAWSAELLPRWELGALMQTAVFRGGFDVPAAVAVLDMTSHPDAPPMQAVLESLVDKALLRVQPGPRGGAAGPPSPDQRRYDLPGVVRAFVEARQDVGDPQSALVQRHAAHFLKLCGSWAENADGHGGGTARAALASESENLIAVVQRAFTASRATLATVAGGLQGTLALEPVLLTRGPHALFIELLTMGLAHADDVEIPDALRARAHEARARAHRALHALDQSLSDLEQALSRARRGADPLLEARARANIGTHFVLVHDLPRARFEYVAALQLFSDLKDRRLYARAEGFMALLEHEEGDLNGAIDRYRSAITLHREVGDRRWEAIHTGQLGAVQLEACATDAARAHVSAAISMHRELSNHRLEALTWITLGDVELVVGEQVPAQTCWERARGLLARIGDPASEVLAVARLAAHAAHHTLPEAPALRARVRELEARLHSPTVRDAIAVLIDGPSARARTAMGAGARAAARVAELLQRT